MSEEEVKKMLGGEIFANAQDTAAGPANVNDANKGRRRTIHERVHQREPVFGKPVSMKDYATWVLLQQTQDALLKLRQQELSQYGISAEQAAVLFVVQAIGHSATLSEISRWMLRRPHSVCAILSRMERKGLVRKTKNRDRKNLVRITLTEKGKQTYYQSTKIQSIRKIMSCLSEEERQQLTLCLHKLRAREFEELRVESDLTFLQSLAKSSN